MIKLHQLQAFLEAAKSGSIRKAAEELGLSQPSLSRSLTLLEREVGTPLLRRSVRGVSVTPAGRKLLSRARLIEHEISSIQQEFRLDDETPSGEVSIGVSPLFAINYLPRFLAEFRVRYPRVQPKVCDGLYPSIWERLRDGTIDAYFGPIPLTNRPADLAFETLLMSQMMVTVRKGHPLMRATSIADLASASWVVAGHEDGPGRIMYQVFRDNRLEPPEPAVSCESFLAMMSLIGRSDMVGMLPESMLDASAYDLMRVPVTERLPQPRQGLTVLKQAAPHPAAALFIKHFKAWIRQHMPAGEPAAAS
jgi:LysR family transcriptional regulator, regulator of abg operon